MVLTNDSALIRGETGQLEVCAEFMQDSDGLAIICHPHPLYGGTMDNKVVTTLARYFKNQGIHVVRFNFRGVGKSEGKFDDGVGEVNDVFSVLEWASNQVHTKKLYIAGFSFGGYVAAKFCQTIITQNDYQHWQVERLVLVAPAVGRYNMSQIHLPTKKTQLIYGAEDDVVSPDELAKFGREKNIATSVVPDVGHFFHGHLHVLIDAVAAGAPKTKMA